MQIKEINTIAVVGAGTMGLGIAQLAATAGYPTLLFDVSETALEKASTGIQKNLSEAVNKNKISIAIKEQILNKISFSTNILQVTADIVIEAIVEQLEAKVHLFTTLSKQTCSKTIFASNTSSIPITRIARQIPYPERVVGMHFFNPPHILKLVEVIKGAKTSDNCANTIFELAKKMGKTPVFAADSAGFIVNRVARPYYTEALTILEEDVADFETIDNIMQNCGFKMGPFALMDLIGVDVNFSVTQSIFEAFYYPARFRPSRIQQQKVDAGMHGKKTGAGFYIYPSENK